MPTGSGSQPAIPRPWALLPNRLRITCVGLLAASLISGRGLAQGPSEGTAKSLPPSDAFAERISDILNQATLQYAFLLESLRGETNLPRSFVEGRLRLVPAKDWTSGFFPGSLWLLYEATGKPRWKRAAQDYTARLESVKDRRTTHDLGFMLNCSYGNGYRLTRNPHYKEVLLHGANTLSRRFKPEVGLIRSWDHKPWQYPVIIDNMMNLELLTWASKTSADADLMRIALQHADATMRDHFRPDASSWHVVDYNPTNGAILCKKTHQGAADSSVWARGQAWGLYGFTMMHRQTGRTKYREQAERIARFLMNHPRLPPDKIPYWDFDAPGIPDAPRDASAGAIMASALIELSQAVDPEFGRQCLKMARTQLDALSSSAYLASPGENGGFLLQHCVGHMPKQSEVDVPLIYADYYFLEAVLRYRAWAESAGLTAGQLQSRGKRSASSPFESALSAPSSPSRQQSEVTPLPLPGSEAFVFRAAGRNQLRLFVANPTGWSEENSRAGLALSEPRHLELWQRLPADPTHLEVRCNIAMTQPLLWRPTP